MLMLINIVLAVLVTMKISVLVYVLVLMLMVQRCSSGILAGIAAATGTIIAGGSATGAAKIIIGKCFVRMAPVLKTIFHQCLFVCLFDLILYVPSAIFQLNRDGSSWVESVLS